MAAKIDSAQMCALTPVILECQRCQQRRRSIASTATQREMSRASKRSAKPSWRSTMCEPKCSKRPEAHDKGPHGNSMPSRRAWAAKRSQSNWVPTPAE
jgi:hypothetical protein